MDRKIALTAVLAGAVSVWLTKRFFSSRPAITAVPGKTAVAIYSPAKMYNGLVYTAGQVALGADGKLVGAGDFTQEATQCLSNLVQVLREANSSPAQVIKVTAFLTDMTHYAAFNSVYATFFGAGAGVSSPPARSCVAVKALPMGALVEVEAVAVSSA
eukprot:g25628.t1